jgi:hypothetical protein
VALYRSRPAQGGARYEVLAGIELAAAQEGGPYSPLRAWRGRPSSGSS